MRHNDIQLGKIEVLYSGTQSAIQAMQNPVEGMKACATDTHLEGFYNGTAWIWSTAHSNVNDPTEGQKAALAGSSGTPGAANKYVTDGDARNTNARTPSTHSHAAGDVTGTAVVTNDARLSDNRTPIDASATNAKLANMATKTYKGRTSGTTGPPEDVAVATLKSDLVLNNVDNTTDIGKPVSTDTQTALDSKLDDTQFSGLSKISVGTSTPGSPSVGDLWVDTN